MTEDGLKIGASRWDEDGDGDLSSVLRPLSSDAARREHIMMLASALLARRGEALAYRAASGVETRWREDQDAFDFMDGVNDLSMMGQLRAGGAVKKKAGSQVKINIIRAKTETAVGRFADISMPVDDRNWGLEVTPVPEMADAIKDERPAMQADPQTGATKPVTDGEGNQATMADVAKDQIAKAKERMAAMQTEIDDQLVECHYNGEVRKIIYDAARLGTGILKGPMIIRRTKKAWRAAPDGLGAALIIAEEHRPASMRVDPWNVWVSPSCDEDITRAEYFWERRMMLRGEIAELSSLPGYDAAMIAEALAQPPSRVESNPDKGGLTEARAAVTEASQLYEVWEYNGDVPREMCECMGEEVPMALISAERLSAAVVFVNDLPIKLAVNPLDAGFLPYDFLQWTTVGGSPWGIGIPRMMQWQQRVATAAWRAMMDNAGDSAGQHIIVGRGVEPADGRWELNHRKVWRCTDPTVSAANAFAQFQLMSRQQELANIIELALRFGDMETGIPVLFQGEQGKLPETLGATNIMVDANNVALRSRIKRFDDQITIPHLTRYYHWNMQYSERDDIKGDFQVAARGVSALLAKDQQAQSILQLYQLMADPDIAVMVDKQKMAKQLFAAHHLDILKPEDQIAQEKQQQQQAMQQQQQAQAEAAQQQQQDQGGGGMASAAIQAAQIRAQAQLQVAQLNQQSDMSELQLKQAMDAAGREHEMRMKQMDLQIQMMKLANDKNISLEQIKAQLASDSMKLRTQKELSVAALTSDEMKRSGMVVPQVAMPPTEPIGQAPPGQAFQR